MRPYTAKNAVKATNIVVKKILESQGEEGWPVKQANEIVAEGKATSTDTPAKLNLEKAPNKIAEASRFLSILAVKAEQEKYGFIDPLLKSSNAVELFAAMTALMHLVYWTIVIFIGKIALKWKSESTKNPATCLAVTTAFLLVFALCSAFNIQVRELLFGSVHGSARGDFLGGIGALTLGSLLTVIFLRDGWLDIAKIVYPSLLGCALYVFVTKWFGVTLSFLGKIDNPVILIVLLLASVIFVGSSVFFAMFLPTDNLNSSAQPSTTADRQNVSG